MFAKWCPFLFGLNVLCRPSNGFSTHTDDNVETNDMNLIIVHKNALPMANIDSIARNVTSRLCNTNIYLISRVEGTPVLKWTEFSGDGFSSACIKANPCFASFVAMSSNTCHRFCIFLSLQIDSHRQTYIPSPIMETVRLTLTNTNADLSPTRTWWGTLL